MSLNAVTDVDVFGCTSITLRVREIDKSIQIRDQASEDS